MELNRKVSIEERMQGGYSQALGACKVRGISRFLVELTCFEGTT
jgi:hypothetical protein